MPVCIFNSWQSLLEVLILVNTEGAERKHWHSVGKLPLQTDTTESVFITTL